MAWLGSEDWKHKPKLHILILRDNLVGGYGVLKKCTLNAIEEINVQSPKWAQKVQTEDKAYELFSVTINTAQGALLLNITSGWSGGKKITH